jgi:hypothetical protein
MSHGHFRPPNHQESDMPSGSPDYPFSLFLAEFLDSGANRCCFAAFSIDKLAG